MWLALTQSQDMMSPPELRYPLRRAISQATLTGNLAAGLYCRCPTPCNINLHWGFIKICPSSHFANSCKYEQWSSRDSSLVEVEGKHPSHPLSNLPLLESRHPHLSVLVILTMYLHSNEYGLWEALTMDQLLSQGVSDTTASKEALDAVKSWSESVFISFIIVNQWEEKGIIYCTTQQTTKHDSESYLQKHIATGFKKEYVKKECEQVCMQVSCKHSSHIVLLCHHHFLS
jgi:hypothetical protein